MNAWQLRQGLQAIIILLVKTHPAGFRVLLGDYDPPDTEEICSMLGALHDDADPDIRVNRGGDALSEAIKIIEAAERFNSIIDEVGGWPHINKVVHEWTRHHASTWNMIIDHAVWVSCCTSRTDGTRLMHLEQQYGISRKTIWRKVKEFPDLLSNAIILAPRDAV